MKAELVPDNGDPPIAITKDLTVVGRRGYCDVVVEDPSISKRHCVLVKTDGLIVVRDLGSTNGTKVKGQRVRWAALLPDDRISLGSYKFRVYLGPDDTPGPSELAEIRKARALARAADLKPPSPPELIAVDARAATAITRIPAQPPHAQAGLGPPIGPGRGAAEVPSSDPIDLEFVNAKTPVDGQEAIIEID
jgi:predicted component of type VI protein secretion system